MEKTFLPGNTRQRIQDLIKKAGMTQGELSEKIGISESAFSRYLQGRTEMLGDGYILRIANYFQVSVDFILGETDIPDRKNYDIAELGFSEEAVKNLYSGKADQGIVSQLLENEDFCTMTHLLTRYQNETMMNGIRAMNQNLSFVNSMLMGHAKGNPCSADAVRKATRSINKLKLMPSAPDTEMINRLFRKTIFHLKENAQTEAEEKKTANAETLERFRQELCKGQDAPDLKNMTPGDLSEAIIKTSGIFDISESFARRFENLITEYLDFAASEKHDG